MCRDVEERRRLQLGRTVWLESSGERGGEIGRASERAVES